MRDIPASPLHDSPQLIGTPPQSTRHPFWEIYSPQDAERFVHDSEKLVGTRGITLADGVERRSPQLACRLCQSIQPGRIPDAQLGRSRE